MGARSQASVAVNTRTSRSRPPRRDRPTIRTTRSRFVGRATPEFVVDAFDVSYGDPQTVAVTARRDQSRRRLNYRVDGRRIHRVPVTEWRGGERYGDERDVYYAEYRGKVRGARPGDRVEVWFTASRAPRGTVESDHFTYKQLSDAGADALVVANEDLTGVNPAYPAGTTRPKYTDDYAAALEANGVSRATWDVDAQGVPHPLGVLSHFDAVVWESGDDRLPQDREDLLADKFLLGPTADCCPTTSRSTTLVPASGSPSRARPASREAAARRRARRPPSGARRSSTTH